MRQIKLFKLGELENTESIVNKFLLKENCELIDVKIESYGVKNQWCDDSVIIILIYEKKEK